MVYGHCMAKSSAFLKQMTSESSSSLNIDYSLFFFFLTENIVRCSGVLRKKERKFIPKPGMVYATAVSSPLVAKNLNKIAMVASYSTALLGFVD